MNDCRLVVDRDHPIQADLVRGRYRHRVRLRRHTHAVGIAAARRKGVEGVKRKEQGTNVVDRDHTIPADPVRDRYRLRLRVRPRRHTRDGGMTATSRKGGERAKRKRSSAIVVIVVLVAVMNIRAKR